MDANITIYNRKLNSTTKVYEFHPTQISGVNWYTDQKATVTDGGLKSADIYKVRIPEENSPIGIYVDDKTYQAKSDVTGYWTIQKDDLVVLGLVSDSITSQADLTKKYSQVFKVNSYSDNRHGGLPHWRIGGV